jgi:hypothetical protein
MPTIAEARAATAAALATVPFVTGATAKPTKKNPRPGDAWVTPGQLRPATFAAAWQTLVADVVLATDLDRFEDLYDAHALAVFDAITKGVSNVEATLDPVEIPVGVAGSGAVLYGVRVTFLVEVTAT